MRSSMKPALNQDFFFPTHDFVYRNAFLIMKLSKLPRFSVTRALIASQSTFNILFLIFLLLFLYLILHNFCSVLTCDIMGIGLLWVQYLFKTIICSSVKMKKSHTIL